MPDQEPLNQPEKDARVEITDRKTLGTVDFKNIPSGYGIVLLNSKTSEFLITNNTGDVMLFIDHSTRNMSSMKLKEVEWDGAFLSGIEGLPQEYQDQMEKAKMPKTIYLTNSPEGTEFVHALGKGTPEKPLEFVQRSTQVCRHISLVHLAMIKHVSITKEPITVSLNQVLFTYTPKGDRVEMNASTTFRPPRNFDDIERDIKADKSIGYVESSYYKFLTDNPGVFKTPTEWYRKVYFEYRLNMAKSMFEKVAERVYKKDL